jgi:hypothetical protein
MTRAWDGTDAQLAMGMRSLKGQCCTLSHQRPIAAEVQRRGLMKFHEWPSGHWALTQHGLNFLADAEWEQAR